MHRRTATLSIVAALVIGSVATASAQAAGPIRESDAYTERFHDGLILELCGIDTWTTLIERWTWKLYPDGSEMLQVTRTFIPDDPRIPIEKGAGISFTAADGSRLVIGKPLQLFEPDGGVRILDAGIAAFDADGRLVLARGPHPSLDADLVELYCP